MWTRATRAILPRTLNSSRNHLNAYSSRPWYVEEDPEPKSPFQEPTTAIKPPPEGIPDHLSTVYSFLATSPYLEPLSLVVGPPDKQADVDLPLPLLKSVRKSRKRVKERGYGVGVSEGPGQGVYNWILMAQVKEGAESRGAIESVSSSLRALLQQQYPMLPIPRRGTRNPSDGWAMLDIGDTAIHIVSKSAWAKWMDNRRSW